MFLMEINVIFMDVGKEKMSHKDTKTQTPRWGDPIKRR
jgi:hypothetical protein